ncbi:DUF3300 domain-containing protein [Methylocystis heyeri]|uniref:DUF3300 domain-containing protein n=1 Tax=Methylocystis heyeri TaxID=391905 RepID=A0A6B8KH77_9HYPH|nr:DUF3300 domain-containing protein [Methylocystis heyeri]QGM45918.1 DUF3300 domain-containing protein [Methylocystis heyeri]
MTLGKNRPTLGERMVSSVACLLIALAPQVSLAEDPVPAPVPNATPATPPAPEAPAQSRFTQQQLETLLAPIALYPDALLAQLLPASAYPLDIVQAARWLESNKSVVAAQDFSGVDAQNWDPSVKAMARFPEVLRKMNDDLGWTTNLGDAIVNQPQDVANVIQLLRAKAQKAGVLKTTREQKVATETQGGREVVTIQSQDPSVVYVPSYDPNAVYQQPAYDATGAAVAAGLLTFGAAVAIGSAWSGNYWNWGTGAFYPPVWPGYPGWRPPYAGWRPGQPVGGGIGARPPIANGPWRPDGGRYRPGGRPPGGIGGRPGLGGGIGGRPGLGGGIGGRPGLGGGIGGRPGLGGGVGGRPGLGGGVGGRPGARPRPIARPATRPVARPHAGGARRGAAARPRAGFHHGARPQAGFHRGGFGGAHRGGFGGARRGGGFGGGGFHRGGGGFRGGGGGGFHRGGGGGGFRGGGGRRSDLRLKHGVMLLGRLENGLGVYRFVYNGGERAYVGVIAQEVQAVMPEAVAVGRDGYLRVFYDRLGVEFQTYDHWVATGAHLPTRTQSQ